MTQKVAWITGAGRGIGEAITRRLASDGFSVVLSDLNLDAAQQVATDIGNDGAEALALLGDVTDQASVDGNVAAILERFGRIDVQVANAGICIAGRAEDLNPAQFEQILAVNTVGVWRCNMAVVATMREQGGGKIINAGSIGGHRGSANNSIYCASKFAVVGITQCLALELAADNITVNAYCPGIVDTDMWVYIDEVRSKLMDSEPGSGLAAAIDGIPLGRIETTQDVAKFVSFLASPDADYMTGQSVNICGGIHMC